MSRDAFWDALLHDPAVTRQTLKRLSGLVRLHCERIVEYGLLGVNSCIQVSEDLLNDRWILNARDDPLLSS